MDDSVDLLKIKIEKAREQLPPETVKAIDSVNWKASILELRETKGYTFEQLGNLEIETELLLFGLVNINEYPKELEKRMGLSKAQVNELVEDMNKLVFNKIKAELIKNVENKRASQRAGEGEAPTAEIPDIDIKKEHAELSKAGIEIIHDLPNEAKQQAQTSMQNEKLELPEGEHKPAPSILTEKLSRDFKTPAVKTEHTLENITKSSPSQTSANSAKPKVDPYREIPE